MIAEMAIQVMARGLEEEVTQVEGVLARVDFCVMHMTTMRILSNRDTSIGGGIIVLDSSYLGATTFFVFFFLKSLLLLEKNDIVGWCSINQAIVIVELLVAKNVLCEI